MNNPVFVFADGAAIVAAPAAESAAPAATTATAVPAEEGASAPAAQPPSLFGGLGGLFPFVLIFGLFYFMMIRPQQRKEKERRKMIEELRAGTKVIFAGGIIGTIAEANEKTFLIDTAEGRMEVLRSAVQGVAAAEPAVAK